MQKYDLIIVGSGPVGLRLLVIEKYPMSGDRCSIPMRWTIISACRE